MHDVTFSCPPITSEISESNGLFKTLSHQRVLTLALMVAVYVMTIKQTCN